MILRAHITNLYGLHLTNTAQKAQHRIAKVAVENLGFNELGIYRYDVSVDSPEMLRTRLDGIISSVEFGDIAILQYPMWNLPSFDETLLDLLSCYKGLKKVVFVHDMWSLTSESHRFILKREVGILNRADLVILPSRQMEDFLRSEGLTVKKTVIQRMWDFPVTIDSLVRPKFGRVINFAGNVMEPKFVFAREWNYDEVELRVTAKDADWAQGNNIRFLGWFTDDTLLVNALRCSGGFGLLWSEDFYWREYMKMNACYKLSAYLAAGIPVIVWSEIPEKDTIIRKNLGLAVDSLDEAVEKVSAMTQEEYDKMVDDVAVFSELVRGSYFAKKILTDAVFQLLHD